VPGPVEALRVTAVAAGGDGVAREPSGRVVLVAGALPGELVDAEIVDQRRARRMDVVVADPPRAGLGRGGTRAVAATRAHRLALVSCDPSALGRDVRLLAEAGYRLVDTTLIDLFPHTPHVEVVSRFDRVASG
jgi:23S rRNA (uracil1939-C5)-methyltransferase